MLFDLRGAGRRTTIKVVYLSLALLMGGGLVLFGIGGDVSGGLVDAITDRSAVSDNSADRYRERVQQAERRTRANPEDPEAWAALVRARYQLASAGGFFDQATGQFTPEGQAQLRQAAAAWERYLELDPEQPDASIASLMVQAYSQFGLNQPEEAVRAAEVITQARPTAANYARLSILAYQAGQTRKGDLARKAALRETDKDERESLKAELDAAKQQALQAQIQQSLPDDAAGGGDAGGGGGGNNGGGGGGSER